MYEQYRLDHRIPDWLDRVLERKRPPEAAAVCFNLYEDGGDTWSLEVVGTRTFDPADGDWACGEVTDFGTRTCPLTWKKRADWSAVLREVREILERYLESGRHADVLRGYAGVGLGFVDGDVEVLIPR